MYRAKNTNDLLQNANSLPYLVPSYEKGRMIKGLWQQQKIEDSDELKVNSTFRFPIVLVWFGSWRTKVTVVSVDVAQEDDAGGDL